MTPLANGKLIKEEFSADKTLKTTHWELKEAPCPTYLICVAVGHLVEVEDETVDNIPIKYYAPKNTPADWLKRSFDKTPAMMKWIQKKLDYPFPWPKYFQIASPSIGGAMENISLVLEHYIFSRLVTF